MKKVAIYCRVSTALQEQEKTIESQLSELKEVCKDFEIVEVYQDNGWSGGNLMRPDLDRMREDAKKRLFEALYIHSTDRLSRNLYHQGILVEELKKSGVEIFIKDKPIADTPDGKFMFNIMGAVAEYEKEKILERTHRGKLYKARTKGIVGGYACYGYRYIKKVDDIDEHFVVNEKEAEIVNLIFDIYIKTQSTNRTVRELSVRNVMPQRGGRKWSRSVIGKLLRNETYIGMGYYNKWKSIEVENGRKYNRNVKTGRVLRNKSEWILTPYPAIIDKEKFNTAQQILSQKYKPYFHCKHFYLLSGLVRCSKCNSTFTGETRGKEMDITYYRCNQRHSSFPAPNSCNAPSMKTPELDVPVWNTVSEIVASPKVIKKYILLLSENNRSNVAKLEKEKERLSQKELDLEKKKNRLVEIYTDGGITKEQYFEKKNIYDKEGEDIKQTLEKLNLSVNQVIDRSLLSKRIKSFCSFVKKKLKNLSPEQKKEFLRYIFERIELDSNKREVKIIGNIPIEEPVLPDISSGMLSMSLKP